jgi:hypothetical protein
MFVFVLLIATTAHAQLTRTWVSGSGSDSDPCSFAVPCKTFAGAHLKTAPHGEITVKETAGFGGLTIDTARTIDGSGSRGGILAANSTAIFINAPGQDVVLRNLDINGVGSGIDGIRIIAAKSVVIDNCTIQGFTGNAVAIINAADNVLVSIRNAQLHGNGNGINVATTNPGRARLVVADSHLTQNTYGLNLGGENNLATLVRSEFDSNASAVRVEKTSSRVQAESCSFEFHAVAFRPGSGAETPIIRLSRSLVANNTLSYTGAGMVTSCSNNVIVDNGGFAFAAGCAEQ